MPDNPLDTAPWHDRNTFRAAMRPHALAALHFPILATWAVEKAVQETNGGRNIPPDSYNVLGYKATGDAPSVIVQSLDWSTTPDGPRAERRNVAFRIFPLHTGGYEACFRQFGYALFQSRYYRNAFRSWVLAVETIWCPRHLHPEEILTMLENQIPYPPHQE